MRIGLVVFLVGLAAVAVAADHGRIRSALQEEEATPEERAGARVFMAEKPRGRELPDIPKPTSHYKSDTPTNRKLDPTYETLHFIHHATDYEPAAHPTAGACHYKTVGSVPSSTPFKFKLCGTWAQTRDAALAHAYSAWRQAAPGVPKLEFDYAPCTGSASSSFGKNGANEIYAELLHTDKSGGLVLAEHRIRRRRDTKQIVEADIVFNDDPRIAWGKDYDFTSVAITEWGGVLGLGYADTHDHSMMGRTLSESTHKHTLECGDLAGIRSLYGSRV